EQDDQSGTVESADDAVRDPNLGPADSLYHCAHAPSLASEAAGWSRPDSMDRMAFQIPSDLHPDLMPVAWLLGNWHGNGRGEYPTIEAFGFEQDVAFAHDGRPFLHYFSRTWITDDEGNRLRPGALETGFLRPSGEGGLELVLVHP